MDKITKEQRSRNMSLIRSKGNRSTEEVFVKLLKANKISGWRRHVKGAYGSPDFLFRKNKVVVFLDGCFWHGCKIHCVMPKSNKKYWIEKISRNIKRDRKVKKHYLDKGWKVVRIWEHDLKNHKLPKKMEMLETSSRIEKKKRNVSTN